ncbi:hypothetical protein MACH18_13390 [Phaeobacter italicus]|uniref:hypothetical protein n=1 Tax=Phaeobacter italicus TaxID=481446 RepID=UPI0027458F65|nr:hypothetical protein [Phaeobacter italicus]GLO74259.1 hypothetical protein MACH18_13390 [Phaeobacter italicus]
MVDRDYFPLQGGKALRFSVNGPANQKDWVIVPRELLDDEVGDDASQQEREAWVERNIEQIMEAYTAKKEGRGWVRSPFNQIAIQEAN